MKSNVYVEFSVIIYYFLLCDDDDSGCSNTNQTAFLVCVCVKFMSVTLCYFGISGLLHFGMVVYFFSLLSNFRIVSVDMLSG